MLTRALGATGLRVGELGLGTEYLVGRDRSTVADVIRTAVDHGVNYIDVLFSYPEYRDALGAALRGVRDRFVVAGHVGCAETNGQYRKTRDVAECRALFDDLLARLGTDHVEVVMVQFVDTPADYRRVMEPGGLYHLARDLCAQGKARTIGISLHDEASALRAAATGAFGVLMFPLSIILAPVPMDPILNACKAGGAGFVAMKPYGGGRLFGKGAATGIEPWRLVGYPLLDSRVSTVAVGVKSRAELEQAIRGVDGAPDAGTFREVAHRLLTAGRGECVYCNHCLPCPEEITVAEIMMHHDMARGGVTAQLRASYARLERHASACTECGVCAKRCPFGVRVVERMRETAALLEASPA